MTSLDSLYNNSVGCKSVNPSSAAQTLDLTCQAETGGPPALSGPTGANYDHDVFLEYFPIGSSFGIKQLTNQGLANIPSLDGARSSRKPKIGDPTALRFVGYAADALSWVCFKSTPGSGCSTMPTDAGGRPTLSQQNLKDIYACKAGSTNWSAFGGADVPIKVYQAQSGSGTRSTWDGFIAPTVTSDSCATPIVENDAGPIITAGQQPGAIFYYSFGRYNEQAPPGRGTTLGRIDGVAATSATVGGQTFPFSRLVYNVIRNNFTTRPPLNVNQEVRDYIDVAGFLCKPADQHETNPITGNNYRTDIENAIKAKGFEPIPLGQTSTSESLPDSFCRVPLIPT